VLSTFILNPQLWLRDIMVSPKALLSSQKINQGAMRLIYGRNKSKSYLNKLRATPDEISAFFV